MQKIHCLFLSFLSILDGPFYYRFYADEGKKDYPMISAEMRTRVAAALLSSMQSSSYVFSSTTPATSSAPSLYSSSSSDAL